jgi:hypothetical protein
MNNPTMKPIRLKTLCFEKECWLLVLFGLVYFYRPLFLGETFFFRDITADVLAQKSMLVSFWRAKELPLWTPYPHGGQPYMADMTYYPLYPTNLLYVFLPFLKAFNLNIVFHIIGGALAAYLCARTLGFQPVSSLLTGLVYAFCGYSLSLTTLSGRFLVLPYIPLLLLSWHRYLLASQKKWFVIAVLLGVLQVMAGAPETNVVSLLSLLGWSLVYPYPQISIVRRLVRWITLGAVIIGVSAIQLFPTIEMVSQSYRWGGVNYKEFTLWSLYPQALPELIFPGFFGDLDKYPPLFYYWGGKLMQENFPCIVSLYCGCVAIVLTLCGGLSGIDRNQEFCRRVRLFLLVLCLLSLLLSLGRFLPGFPILHRFVPLITLFRFPIKFLIAGLLPVALLTGYASEQLFGGTSDQHLVRVPSVKLIAAFWSLAAILILFTLTFQVSDAFANRVIELYFQQSARDNIRHGLRTAFAHTTALWFLFTLLTHYRKLTARSWQHWILVGIFMVDYLVASKQVNFYAPAEFFTATPDIVQMVRQEIGDGRFYRQSDPPAIQYRFPSNDTMWLFRRILELLDLNTAEFYEIPILFHNPMALTQARILKFKNTFESSTWEERLPLLSAGAVTVILTHENLSLPNIEHIADIPNRSNIPFYLYRNKAAAARIQFVTSGEFVTSDQKAMEVMLAPGYDPRKQVVLQQPEKTMFDLDFRSPAGHVPVSNVSECPSPVQIHKQRATTHSAELTVSTRCDGYLVFAESFYPGWRVYVDGKRTPVWRANYAFSAIPLQAGDHEVTRVYRPISLAIGILCSVIFGIGLWMLKL